MLTTTGVLILIAIFVLAAVLIVVPGWLARRAPRAEDEPPDDRSRP